MADLGHSRIPWRPRGLRLLDAVRGSVADQPCPYPLIECGRFRESVPFRLILSHPYLSSETPGRKNETPVSHWPYLRCDTAGQDETLVSHSSHRMRTVSEADLSLGECSPRAQNSTGVLPRSRGASRGNCSDLRRRTVTRVGRGRRSLPGVGPSPEKPFALSAPTLRRGVSKGPHDAVLGWGQHQHWRQGCVRPSIRAAEAATLLRVNGLRGPLNSEQLRRGASAPHGRSNEVFLSSGCRIWGYTPYRSRQ